MDVTVEQPLTTGADCDMLSVQQILRRLWPIALVTSMLDAFIMLEAHFYLPYLYTRVECCDGGNLDLDRGYDVTRPEQVRIIQDESLAEGLTLDLGEQVVGLPHNFSTNYIRACSVPRFSSGSQLWSLSPSCTNKAFVEDTAQGIVSVMKPLQKVAGFAVLPIGGAVADSAGRKPVLVTFGACLVLACIISTLDTRLYSQWGDGAVYAAGMLLCVAFQPKDSVCSGAVADLMGNDDLNKGRAFIMLRGLNSVVALMSNMGVYLLLSQHLERYDKAWLGCAMAAALTVVVLVSTMPETLPEKMRREITPSMFNPLRTHFFAFRLLTRDWILIELSVAFFLFYMYFLGFLTTKVSYLVLIGFSIQETVLPEMVANLFQPAFAALLLHLLPKIGVWWVCIIGHGLFAASFAFWGPFAVAFGSAGPYLGNLLLSCGVVVIFPAFQTILSQRVEVEHQSKCQAALSAAGTAGAIVGIPFYSRGLFSATAHGYLQALPAMFSMLLALVCMGLSVHMMAMARRKPDWVAKTAAVSPLAVDMDRNGGDGCFMELSIHHNSEGADGRQRARTFLRS